VLFEAAKRLAEIDDSLLSLKTVFHLEQQQGGVNWLEAKLERQKRWIKSSAAFDESRVLVGIVCGAETIAALEKFGSLAYEIAAKLNTDPDAYTISQIGFTKNLFAARAAIRKELGIVGDVATQTSESTIAPNCN